MLRAGAGGEKLDDLAPMWGSGVALLLQAAVDDFRETCLLAFKPPSNLIRYFDGHLHRTNITLLPKLGQAWLAPKTFYFRSFYFLLCPPRWLSASTPSESPRTSSESGPRCTKAYDLADLTDAFAHFLNF